MNIIINGSKVHDFGSFVSELVAGMPAKDRGDAYFGFDLNSFSDCLHGGYLGYPPYDIVATDGHHLIRAMGHDALVHYCSDMLRIIECGGRGLVQADSRRWYEVKMALAQKGAGETLLELLCEVIREAPASLTLLDEQRRIVRTCFGMCSA